MSNNLSATLNNALRHVLLKYTSFYRDKKKRSGALFQIE